MTSSSAQKLDGTRVLIVENSWHLAEALRMTVEQAGGTVAGIAATLVDANRLLAGPPFQAAVVDFSLRDGKSTPLIKQLVGNGVKVVVVSGHDLPDEIRSVARACLEKPASPDDIVAALAG